MPINHTFTFPPGHPGNDEVDPDYLQLAWDLHQALKAYSDKKQLKSYTCSFSFSDADGEVLKIENLCGSYYP